MRKTVLFMFTMSAISGICSVAGAAENQPPQQKKSAAKAGAGTLTGCVDQQEGRYVLVDDRDLKPIASLEADGFPTEGFAKYMGNKVTVRGTVRADGSAKVVKVKGVEKLSETCTAAQDK
jgi:outer membrane biosynthesis protein TonB